MPNDPGNVTRGGSQGVPYCGRRKIKKNSRKSRNKFLKIQLRYFAAFVYCAVRVRRTCRHDHAPLSNRHQRLTSLSLTDTYCNCTTKYRTKNLFIVNSLFGSKHTFLRRPLIDLLPHMIVCFAVLF